MIIKKSNIGQSIRNSLLCLILGTNLCHAEGMGETSLDISTDLLPYHDKLKKRDPSDINLIVIHSTELSDMKEARFYAERILYPQNSKNSKGHYGDGTGAAGHYYVDRQGQITRYINDARIAHHVKGHNKKTIGIEVVNRGRYPQSHFSRNQNVKEEFPEAQIIALAQLINHLKEKYPGIKALAGHVDLDRRLVPANNAPHVLIRRKLDPGPLFPWEKISRMSGLKRIRPYFNIKEE